MPSLAAPGSELWDAALWHTVRHGPNGDLVHPLENGLAPASVVIHALLDETTPDIESAGDLAIATALTEQLLRVGTGADRQHQAFALHGREGLAAILANAIKNESLAHHPAAGHLGPDDPDR